MSRKLIYIPFREFKNDVNAKHKCFFHHFWWVAVRLCSIRICYLMFEITEAEAGRALLETLNGSFVGTAFLYYLHVALEKRQTHGIFLDLRASWAFKFDTFRVTSHSRQRRCLFSTKKPLNQSLIKNSWGCFPRWDPVLFYSTGLNHRPGRAVASNYHTNGGWRSWGHSWGQEGHSTHWTFSRGEALQRGAPWSHRKGRDVTCDGTNNWESNKVLPHVWVFQTWPLADCAVQTARPHRPNAQTRRGLNPRSFAANKNRRAWIEQLPCKGNCKFFGLLAIQTEEKFSMKLTKNRMEKRRPRSPRGKNSLGKCRSGRLKSRKRQPED